MRLTKTRTRDGSFTYRNESNGQLYNSPRGTRRAAENNFVKPLSLRRRMARRDRINVVSICFGLGVNTAAVIEAFSTIRERESASTELHVVGLEIDRAPLNRALEDGILREVFPEAARVLAELANRDRATVGPVHVEVRWGDAALRLAEIPDGWADGVLHDPFLPDVTPELWTEDFVARFADKLRPDGVACTYSSVPEVVALYEKVFPHVCVHSDAAETFRATAASRTPLEFGTLPTG